MPVQKAGFNRGRPMTISVRFVLGISAAALSLSLGLASAALAQDAMTRDLEFRNSLSRRDTPSTDTIVKDAKEHGRHWGAAFYRR
jgi:pentapeptide MXKDX repeat protein